MADADARRGAIASPSRPPRWFDVGNRLLLTVLVLVSLTWLVRGSAQRSWLRTIAATGKVPGVSPRPTATSSISPCPHPVASGVAELSAEFTEPIEVSRAKPRNPEEARLQRAVMQWTYEPATRKSDGSPVAVYLKVTVKFRLE